MNLQYLLQAGRVTDEERKANSTRPVHLTLVSFAVTRKAYEVITERFAEEYEAATGVPVKFRLSFGGSGTQVTASDICPLLPAAATRHLDAEKNNLSSRLTKMTLHDDSMRCHETT